jgi:hypothetical protein
LGNTPALPENTTPPGETNPTVNEGWKLPLAVCMYGQAKQTGFTRPMWACKGNPAGGAFTTIIAIESWP